MTIELNEKEINLLRNALRDYENKHYDSISKEENDFMFSVMDKLNKELIKEMVQDGYLFEPRKNEFKGLGINDTIKITIEGDLK